MFVQQAKLHIFERGENSLLAPTGTGASPDHLKLLRHNVCSAEDDRISTRQLADDHGFAPPTGRTDETNDATDAAPCWL